MDFVEKATWEFLTSLDLGEVVYEPCGKKTFPDFSLSGNIGIECTRLVHTIPASGSQFNATELEPRIIHSLQRAIEKKISKNHRFSVFVGISYRMEIDTRKSARNLSRFLDSLDLSDISLPLVHQIDDTLEINIFHANNRFESTFMLGSATNMDGAMWLFSELVEQSRHAMIRKGEKISPKHLGFKEYWLAVSSDLTIGVSDDYVHEAGKALKGKWPWSNLLLIDPNDPRRSRIIAVRD